MSFLAGCAPTFNTGPAWINIFKNCHGPTWHPWTLVGLQSTRSTVQQMDLTGTGCARCCATVIKPNMLKCRIVQKHTLFLYILLPINKTFLNFFPDSLKVSKTKFVFSWNTAKNAKENRHEIVFLHQKDSSKRAISRKLYTPCRDKPWIQNQQDCL